LWIHNFRVASTHTTDAKERRQVKMPRSYLFEKLQQDAPECGDRMPLGGKPLATTQIDCLKAWVNGLSSASGAGAGGQSSSGGGASPGGGAGPGNPGGGAAATISSEGSLGASTSASGGAAATTGSGGSAGAAATAGSRAGATRAGGSGGATTTGSGGQVGCGPTVSFSSQVQPIFTASCANAGCHTGTRPAGKLTLASGSSYADLVNVAASSCSCRLRVKPSAVSQSYLVNKLLGQDLCSGSQMPKAGSSLPSANLAAINGWICEGAPKN
jgi:hypothetical protein